MSLPFPPLNPLRLASPKDILRMGVIASCAFHYSDIFDWKRPYHGKYPEDTLLSYRRVLASAVKSPEDIVLVALDKYDPEEGKKSTTVIPPDNGAEIPAAGDEVVVGVAYWKLEPGSKRIGQFQNEEGPYPELPPNLNRDENQTNSTLFAQSIEAAGKEYFGGYARLEMVVVHPAYWARGHGGHLVKWGMKLARIDKSKQGVIASKMGIVLYNKLGWKYLTKIHIEGDERGVSVAVAEYDPTARE